MDRQKCNQRGRKVNIFIRFYTWRSGMVIFCLSINFWCTSVYADLFDDCKSGTPAQITADIQSGADVNAKDNNGYSPLMFAADHNSNTDVIKALINAGADVNAKDNGGFTPLIFAASYNKNSDMITILIKAGANVNATDK